MKLIFWSPSFSGLSADPIRGRVRAPDRPAAPTTTTTAPGTDPTAARSEAAARLASPRRLSHACPRQPHGARSRADDAAQPVGSPAGERPTAMAATTAGRHAVHNVAPATTIHDATTTKAGSTSWPYAQRRRCSVYDQSVCQGSPGEANEKEGLVTDTVATRCIRS